MASRIVAVTGLAHMITNQGSLYTVTQTDNGWNAARWKVLPGAPLYSRLLRDGDLFVACHWGSIRVSSTGDIRIADEADRRASWDAEIGTAAIRMAVLLGGFVLVLFCAVALLFPCFGELPWRFTLLGTTLLPCAVVIGIFLPWIHLSAMTVLIPAISLALALVPVAFSLIATAKNRGIPRRRRWAYIALDTILAAGLFWALGMNWVVAITLGVL